MFIFVAEIGVSSQTQEELKHHVELLVNVRQSYASIAKKNIAKKNIAKAQQRHKDSYDRRHNTSSTGIQLNDKVLLKNSKHDSRKGGKLEVRWTGPYSIIECRGKGCFKLRNTDGHQVSL